MGHRNGFLNGERWYSGSLRGAGIVGSHLIIEPHGREVPEVIPKGLSPLTSPPE